MKGTTIQGYFQLCPNLFYFTLHWQITTSPENYHPHNSRSSHLQPCGQCLSSKSCPSVRTPLRLLTLVVGSLLFLWLLRTYPLKDTHHTNIWAPFASFLPFLPNDKHTDATHNVLKNIPSINRLALVFPYFRTSEWQIFQCVPKYTIVPPSCSCLLLFFLQLFSIFS